MEIPLSFSISIQSEIACLDAFLARTEPEVNGSGIQKELFGMGFSRIGMEMMAKVRRRAAH